MSRTPGLIVPSAYSSKEELEKDLRRRSEAAGFTPFKAEDNFLEQMDNAAEFLSHYGVKGMKWGVSRSESGKVSVSATAKAAANDVKNRVNKEVAERTSAEVTVRAKPGSIVRVVGGNRRTAHQDAINARIAEQIAKRNTLDALSNKDLQQLVTRMNLEQQYRNLAVKENRLSAGEKMIRKYLASNGDAVFSKLGPLASGTKMVVDSQLKNANKALLGGSTSDKKKDK